VGRRGKGKGKGTGKTTSETIPSQADSFKAKGKEELNRSKKQGARKPYLILKEILKQRSYYSKPLQRGRKYIENPPIPSATPSATPPATPPEPVGCNRHRERLPRGTEAAHSVTDSCDRDSTKT